jgi:hypothetical protein
MDKRSTEGQAEEWRKQWLSGQPPRRTSAGAALRAAISRAYVKSAKPIERHNSE